MSLIFSTIHGSRLYGLDHAGSDRDYYAVYTNDHAFTDGERGQRVRSYADHTEDIVSVTLDEFMKRVEKGSHQALEALFSPAKGYGLAGKQWARFFESHLVGSEVFPVYERTIRKFAFGDFKRRRHGVRLSQNLKAMRALGRFNPRMSAQEITEANQLANGLSGNALLRRLDIPLSVDYAETNIEEKEKE